jgi:hypothetical protein
MEYLLGILFFIAMYVGFFAFFLSISRFLKFHLIKDHKISCLSEELTLIAGAYLFVVLALCLWLFGKISIISLILISFVAAFVTPKFFPSISNYLIKLIRGRFKLFYLNSKGLNVGDIVLVRSLHVRSLFVKLFTFSKYNHVYLYVDENMLLHAMPGQAVFTKNPQRVIATNRKHIKVMRPSSPINIFQFQNIAKDKIGGFYSVRGAAFAALNLSRDVERTFCSKLIATVYNDYGYALFTRDANVILPKHFSNQRYLNSGCLIDASLYAVTEAPEALYQIIAKSEPHVENARALTKFMESAIRITGTDYFKFNEVLSDCINTGKHESELADALESSGYFDNIDLDLRRNPWRYDNNEFHAYLADKAITIDSHEFMGELESILQILTSTYCECANEVKYYLNLTRHKENLLVNTILAYRERQARGIKNGLLMVGVYCISHKDSILYIETARVIDDISTLLALLSQKLGKNIGI